MQPYVGAQLSEWGKINECNHREETNGKLYSYGRCNVGRENP